MVRLAGYDPPYPSTRVGTVTTIAWDKVNLDVSDGLSGGDAVVNAYVVGIRMELFI